MELVDVEMPLLMLEKPNVVGMSALPRLVLIQAGADGQRHHLRTGEISDYDAFGLIFIVDKAFRVHPIRRWIVVGEPEIVQGQLAIGNVSTRDLDLPFGGIELVAGAGGAERRQG